MFCEVTRGREFKEFLIENWKILLEDCKTLIDRVTIRHCTVTLFTKPQFFMEYSDKEIPFLNKLIKRDKNEIWMDLYRKLTDT